jgi:hypothetical protein
VERIPEPDPDAPPWAWSIYFDDRLQLIREDLAAEGTTLQKVLAEMRKRWCDARRRRLGSARA